MERMEEKENMKDTSAPEHIPCPKCEKLGKKNNMDHMKSWTLQGRHQKHPMEIHLYGCCVCGARKRIAEKQTS
jgi:4-hydroxy-3-methylbut-2-en-1-yl diphosphate synthase IspG/GcpE